jgi:ribosomal protein S18 acetylase RimI-like enzyme
MPDHPAVRQLTQGDAEAFRTIRLAGLQEAPTAFGSSYAAERVRTVADFAQTMSRNYIAGAFDEQQLVGVAGFYRLSGDKLAHRGNVWGVFVDPACRGRGVARLLMLNVMEHARGQVEQVHLAVVDGNAPALALYRRLGFVSYGLEPRALRVGATYHDEHLMVWRTDSA